MTCSMHGRDEKCIQNLVENTVWKRTPGILRRRREGSVKMDLKEIRCEVRCDELDSSGSG